MRRQTTLAVKVGKREGEREETLVPEQPLWFVLLGFGVGGGVGGGGDGGAPTLSVGRRRHFQRSALPANSGESSGRENHFAR